MDCPDKIAYTILAKESFLQTIRKGYDQRMDNLYAPALVIMAAGMGSRFGGLKQITPVGPSGEMIIDYSIYDAKAAGFNRVVFVIKKEIEETFKEHIGNRISRQIPVSYVYQELDALPEGFSVPEGRAKPWGTGHAVLCCRDTVKEPFAVINADDYYGVPGYGIMVEHLGKLAPEKQACMVGYYLKNTVSENGHVTRGVCKTDEHNHLVSVTETYKIKPFPDGTIRDTENDENGVILDPDALVSMNFFGFTPWLLQEAEKYFIKFMKSLSPDEMKAEYVLPVLVDQLMHEEGLKVDMLKTDAVWFGVTYKEDKPYVQAELKKMHDAGVYPSHLF